MIATTIEQSQELIRLGLDPNTADMSYSEEYFGKDKDGNDEWCWRLNACRFIDVEGIIHAWSLSALLEVIPRDSALYKIENTYSMHHGWTTENHTNPIDAAYEIVCWLLEQGYIKKGINNE